MNKLFWAISILCICLTACRQPVNNSEAGLVIDLDRIANRDFEIKDLEYIPLETTDACLLGDIHKVIYKNDKFYILDRKRNRGVYIFDKDGRYLSSIQKQGEGPGEYIELMDMDVDEGENIYMADNAKMEIVKYRKADPDDYEVIPVEEHFMEFCYLNDEAFLLRDVFGPKGQKMKLAHFNSARKTFTPILESHNKSIHEMDIMRTSKHSLYRSGERIYYNERFMPAIYSISPEGICSEQYRIASEHYISEEGLKGLEKNPVKFIQETEHIKDLICLYENDSYFVCMPYVSPSATYLVVPKDNIGQASRIDLMEKAEFQGTSQIEGVAKNKFFVVMNYSESQAALLKENDRLKAWDEESNPVLVLFSIE